MAFFQIALLADYVTAHITGTMVPSRLRIPSRCSSWSSLFRLALRAARPPGLDLLTDLVGLGALR